MNLLSYLYVEFKYWKNINFILVFCFLSACSTVTNLSKQADTRVAELIAEQKYTQAIAVISKLDKNHPKYYSLSKELSSIEENLKAYEEATIRQFSKFKTSQRWAIARTIIKEALEKNPDSQVLLAEQEKLIEDIQKYAHNQNIRLAILRANYFSEERDLLENIQLTDPDTPDDQLSVDQAVNQMDEARSILLNQTQINIEKKRWENALNSVTLVNKLKRDIESTKLQKLIEQNIKNRNISKLVAAVDKGDLISAQLIADNLKEFTNDKEVEHALEKLDLKLTRSAHYAQILIDTGQKYYTEGLLDKAISNWEKALKLNPTNIDLEKLLSRAQLFKSNYKKLKKSNQQL